jgi:hypothetical protein
MSFAHRRPHRDFRVSAPSWNKSGSTCVTMSNAIRRCNENRSSRCPANRPAPEYLEIQHDNQQGYVYMNLGAVDDIVELLGPATSHRIGGGSIPKKSRWQSDGAYKSGSGQPRPHRPYPGLCHGRPACRRGSPTQTVLTNSDSIVPLVMNHQIDVILVAPSCCAAGSNSATGLSGPIANSLWHAAIGNTILQPIKKNRGARRLRRITAIEHKYLCLRWQLQ